MKKIIISTLFLGLYTANSYAAGLTGCAAKKAGLESQITWAEKYHNRSQAAGLRKALAEVEEHCTDASLLAERRQKIAEKEQKVAECQAELEQAKATGRTDKITKRQNKLAKAEQELKEAQAMLLK